jgi:hypothetical protein
MDGSHVRSATRAASSTLPRARILRGDVGVEWLDVRSDNRFATTISEPLRSRVLL